MLIALGLFRTIGPKRTRLVSQIAAAIVGASFLIGIQVVAIVSYGSMSRFSLLKPDFLAASAPDVGSPLWLSAYAVSGDLGALSLLLLLAAGFFMYAAHTGASQFRRIVIASLGVSEDSVRQQKSRRLFKPRSTQRTLMQKEWKLLARDPWLISQTLMQVLYLVPPALMLWVNFGSQAELSAILAPVVVMAIGQLAGGLAWLTICGEDAPDLIATAPVGPLALTWAKVKAVLVIIAALVAPIVLAMALMSVWGRW